MLKRVQRCAGLGGGTRRFHQFPLTRVSVWERNRIDEFSKGIIFTQYDSAGSFDLGSKKVNANDNNRLSAAA